MPSQVTSHIDEGRWNAIPLSRIQGDGNVKRRDAHTNVSLADQSPYIDAPRELVFQMLSAIGKGSLPGA